MTPEKLIVSVPHCGTRFLKERLGIEKHIHTTSRWDSLHKACAGKELIVPLRNPVDVWRSWCRRNNPHMFPYAQFYLAWGALQMLDLTYSLDVICIDKQEDQRISDWGKVGDEDASRANWNLLKVDQRHLQLLPIITRHYGSKSFQREVA